MEAAASQSSGDGEQQIFPPSRLWIGSSVIVAIGAIVGIALAINSGSPGALCILFLGVSIFGPAAILFRSTRREVVLGPESLIVRRPQGETTLDLPWETIVDAKFELSPTGRYNQVRLILADDTEKIIIEHQVRRLKQLGAAIVERVGQTTTAPRP